MSLDVGVLCVVWWVGCLCEFVVLVVAYEWSFGLLLCVWCVVLRRQVCVGLGRVMNEFLAMGCALCVNWLSQAVMRCWWGVGGEM